MSEANARGLFLKPANDTDKIRLEMENEEEKRTAENLNTEIGTLFQLRNFQLSKFVQLIDVLLLLYRAG